MCPTTFLLAHDLFTRGVKPDALNRKHYPRVRKPRLVHHRDRQIRFEHQTPVARQVGMDAGVVLLDCRRREVLQPLLAEAGVVLAFGHPVAGNHRRGHKCAEH